MFRLYALPVLPVPSVVSGSLHALSLSNGSKDALAFLIIESRVRLPAEQGKNGWSE